MPHTACFMSDAETCSYETVGAVPSVLTAIHVVTDLLRPAVRSNRNDRMKLSAAAIDITQATPSYTFTCFCYFHYMTLLRQSISFHVARQR